MKKTISIILAILMIVTTIPIAFAAEGNTKIFYVDESSSSHFWKEMIFFDEMGNELNATKNVLDDEIYTYTVSVDAVSYFWNEGIGGGVEISPDDLIPENVDYFDTNTKTWSCSHNMNTSGEQTCKGQICKICGENYGETDPDAHDWSNLDGICANACGAECDHPEQTDTCTICGMELHTCDFSGEMKYDSEKHWKECICGEISEEAGHTLTESKCECGYECPHEFLTQDRIRPVQNENGTWGKGIFKVICSTCGCVTSEKEVERDHEGYAAFEEAVAELEALLNSDELVDSPKTAYTNNLNNLKNVAYSLVYMEDETTMAYIVADVDRYIAAIEAGLADGTMKKADLSYMASLFDEVNAIINGNASLIISSESGKYYDPYYYYQAQLNNKNLTQADYNTNMAEYDFENQLISLITGLKDGTMLKADYTAIDAAIAEVDIKLRDVFLTDEAKAGLNEIKAQLAEMKQNPLTSKADLAELEMDLEEYEAEVDAGIEDGSAVLVDGFAIIYNHSSHKVKELNNKYGKDAYNALTDAASDFLLEESEAIEKEAKALTGTVKENEDKIAELISRLDATFLKIENCLMGVHNVLEYKVIKEAECEKNAIGSAVCTLCGETVTRELENSALAHSFTNYETVEEAMSGVAGKEVASCDYGCGETDEKEIEALTHTDADGDYICDNGCGHEFEKPAPEDPTPDTPDETEDETCADCGKVHTNIFSEIICFFTRIINFIKNLFA